MTYEGLFSSYLTCFYTKLFEEKIDAFLQPSINEFDILWSTDAYSSSDMDESQIFMDSIGIYFKRSYSDILC